MSLRFSFPDAREWRYIISSLAALIEEASFIATSEGLSLRALDPSRVAMVDLFVPREAFEEYELEGEKVTIGVNFNELEKVVKRGKADERIVFEIREGRLRITILGKAERRFSLPLLDIVSEELPTPKVTFTVNAKLLSDTLKEALSDAQLVSDYIRFEAEENNLWLKAQSDRGEVETRLSLEDGSLLEYDITEKAVASYSLEYLSDIVKKADRVSDIAGLAFSSNKPIELTFEFTGGGRLRYYLAPSLET